MLDINEIQRVVTPIAYFYGVKKLYLFGSYAKGTANEKSDIDLLIEKGTNINVFLKTFWNASNVSRKIASFR